ncbi:hypothetical protein [Actinomadura opuntiae]|uniref:hypothetical protein n=1 Tax=Actinomadura sp. OS1-43 TaxID=604315 RepID=UPI00255AFABE|nr:hypothetical protein [Actinomadura sp. OS1-43]MDL4818286.1 hypothetical protein [Actinomadura sp. OS1-43]
MNRSARNLLGLTVAVPLAAALTAAAPANATEGPAADLVYGAVGQVGPALPPVAPPAPVPDAAGRAAALTTGTADGALRSAARPATRTGLAPSLPVSRTGARPAARAACKIDPVTTVDGTRVTRLLPRQTMTLTPGQDAAPISAPRSGSCLGSAARTTGRPAASPFPAPVGEAAKVPGRVVGRVTAVPKRVTGSKVGKMAGAAAALPNGRSAASGGPLGDAVTLGLPGDAASLRSAAPISMVLPDAAAARRGKPAPTSLVGETNDTVHEMHAQVGDVVNVLKTRERPSDTGRAASGDGLLGELHGPPVYLPRLPKVN